MSKNWFEKIKIEKKVMSHMKEAREAGVSLLEKAGEVNRRASRQGDTPTLQTSLNLLL